jgi:hypothetical protein
MSTASRMGVGSHATPSQLDRDLAAAESMERHRDMRRMLLTGACIVIELVVAAAAIILVLHAQAPR